MLFNIKVSLTLVLMLLVLIVGSLMADKNKEQNRSAIFLKKYDLTEKPTFDEYDPDNFKAKKSDINYSIMDKSKDLNRSEYEKKYGKLPDILFDKNITNNKVAKEADTKIRSKEMVQMVDEAQREILFGEETNWSKYAPKNIDLKKMINSKNSLKDNSNNFLEADEKLFIVISSSIPKATIKNYFKILEKVNTDTTFILRGLVGDEALKKMMPTMKYINSLLERSDTNSSDKYSFKIDINPKITQRYNIKRVPAVVFIKGYNDIAEQMSNIIGNADENEEVYITYGDTNIEHVLSSINKEAKSKGIERMLKEINNGFYD